MIEIKTKLRTKGLETVNQTSKWYIRRPLTANHLSDWPQVQGLTQCTWNWSRLAFFHPFYTKKRPKESTKGVLN